MQDKLPFLHVDDKFIADGSGRPVTLRGVALGGWLMMEGYMMCGRNIPEKAFKEALAESLGRDAMEDFTEAWRSTFITEGDIKAIKSWGAACVRVPFNYRVVELETRPGVPNEGGIKYLDRVIEWCAKHRLYCILDMHAAPGSQNEDWHADCVGRPEFFDKKQNQERYYRLWRFLAARYKDESAVAGYDILNEPVILPLGGEGLLKEIYDLATREIRSVDRGHIIFLEGNIWGQRLKVLGRPGDRNTAFSSHAYPPVEYSFNWDIDSVYPGRIGKKMWNKSALESMMKGYEALRQRVGVPLYIGEFGVNWRGGYCGECAWTRDFADLFRKYGWHWTYWTYKTVANPIYPDGLYRYIKNPAWINRRGPVTGWENFYKLWKKERRAIIESWKTKNFVLNTKLLGVLKKYM